MKIQYDDSNGMSILHLTYTQLGTLLFALDFIATHSGSPSTQLEALKLHKEITTTNYHKREDIN